MAISEIQFRVATLAAAAAAMAGVGFVRFCGGVEVPGVPPKPKASVTSAAQLSEEMEHFTGAYNAYVEKDAREVGIRPPDPERMTRVFPYQVDDEEHLMKPGDSIEAAGLQLSLEVDRPKGARRSQMILSIENRRHRPVAYHIDTLPSVGTRACSKMKAVPHNALVVPAGSTIKRAECIYRKGWTLSVRQVESMELPELGAYYLSAVQPEKIGIEPRLAEGHRPMSEKLSCRVLLSASLRKAIGAGKVPWHDMADFYARHRCKTYSFDRSYQAFQRDGERTLPATGGDP
jgi:hypothetical protein